MKNAVYYKSEYLEIIHLRNKPFIYKEHNHISVYTIGLVLDGTVSLTCANSSKQYQVHSYFIVVPYQVHALSVPNTYELITICVDKILLTECSASELFGVFTQILPQISKNIEYSLLASVIDDLFNQKCPVPGNQLAIPGMEYLLQTPVNDDILQTVADEAHYSLYHYIKKFKYQIGITPHKFQIQNSIRKAQRMIENGGMLSDVAQELGFYDQSHFIKCFKRIVGLTPAEYRRVAKKLD